MINRFVEKYFFFLKLTFSWERKIAGKKRSKFIDFFLLFSHPTFQK
jgi:hypothetical protein